MSALEETDMTPAVHENIMIERRDVSADSRSVTGLVWATVGAANTAYGVWQIASQAVPDAEFAALASEEALGHIWDDPAEDEAWRDL
jgi:hypothetical protein